MLYALPPGAHIRFFGEEFRQYSESDLMKSELHPDSKPMGVFGISQLPE